MKKLYLITLLFFSCIVTSHAQNICYGDVTLTTQEEVDAFDCEVVTGTLTITGYDIRNLHGLHTLKKVGEHFIISYSGNFENLEGLENLEKVTCSLEFKNLPYLSDISALSHVKRVGRNLTFINNPRLRSLKGVSQIDSVYNLWIIDNPLLDFCCDVFPIINAGGIYGSLRIENNGVNCQQGQITTCNVEQQICEGDVHVGDQASADNFNCKVITGDLYVSRAFYQTHTQDSLYKLEEVYGDVHINGQEGGASVSGLTNLDSIGGLLMFGDVTGSSVNLNPLASLHSVRGIKSFGVSLSGTMPLNSSLEVLDLFGGGFGSISSSSVWLKDVPSIDTIALSNTAIDVDSVLIKIPDEGAFINLNNVGMEDFQSLTGVTDLNHFSCVCYINSTDGLKDLQHVDYFDLALITRPDADVTPFCGLYNFLKNGTTTEYFALFTDPNFTVDEILEGCAPPEEMSAMTIYPNPVSRTTVNLKWNGDGTHPSIIQLVSPNGHVIAIEQVAPQNGLIDYQYQLGSIPKGIYFVRMITGENIQLRRLAVE